MVKNLLRSAISAPGRRPWGVFHQPLGSVPAVAMDIDQRLEKLTERHEALAETMELVVHYAREE